MEKVKAFLKRKAFKWIFGSVSLVTIFFLFFFVIIFIILLVSTAHSEQSNSSQGTENGKSLPAAVLAYKAEMQTICDEYGMGEYTDVLLAIMAYETGGIGNDPMNVSTSSFNKKYPQVENGITSASYSMRVAVQVFQSFAQQAGLDSRTNTPVLKLVIQAYNFGGSYITWVQAEYDGAYSLYNAQEFSEMRAEENGIAEYGNPNYVSEIMSYLQGASQGENGGGSVIGTGQFLWPVPNFYSISTNYLDPDPNGTPHRGMDIRGVGILGQNILAADSGTVVQVVYGHSSYGNYVQIDHGNGYKTLYAHCLFLLVQNGQTVNAGQAIATVGSTGFSTGPHLHFEVQYNGSLIDPRTVL